MITNDIKVIARNDYYEIEINREKNRVYLVLNKFWDDQPAVSNFLKDITTAIEMLPSGFTMLVDMVHYNGTSKELQNLHFEGQRIVVKAGVSRIAEVFNRNPILKTFSDAYSNKTGAAKMEFQNKAHANRWLDLY